MRIVRSFPAPGDIPPGRAYVQDDLERFITPVAFDYSGLRDVDEDLVLVEWDIAVDGLNLRAFIDRAAGRDWPVVAPFYKAERDVKHWMHFRCEGPGRYRPVYEDEPDCDQFGLGLVYLPGGLLRHCPPTGSIMSDESIGCYLRSRPDWRPVPIVWDIQVTHLH